jgi:tether containing UBX domain for GLUT4
MGGTGGKESLNDLGLVPQSVLMVKWEDESMNGESSFLLRVRSERKKKLNDSNWISCAVEG